MTVPVVVAAVLFWVGVFVVYCTSQGITLSELLLGRWEPPPKTLGTWQELGLDPETGLLREERCLLPEGDARSAYLLHQIRFRDPATRAIVRTEPERRTRRRRSR